VVSKAYSGTGALKTDYTRTGRRTNEGLLQDGINSLMRYVKNNFLDGSRQDAYDLVTGTWQPSKDSHQAFIDRRPLLTRVVPYVALATFSFLFLRFSAPIFTTSKNMIVSALLRYPWLTLTCNRLYFLELLLPAFECSGSPGCGLLYHRSWCRLRSVAPLASAR
jgi:hypothetical protein